MFASLFSRSASADTSHHLFFQQALDFLCQAVMVLDGQGRVSYMNPACQALLLKHSVALHQRHSGFDAGQLIGRTLDSLFDDAGPWQQALQEQRGHLHQTELELEQAVLQLNLTYLRDKQGGLIGNVVEWTDISSVRQQQEQMADHQGQLDAINKIQGVIEFTLDGHVLNVNQNFLDVLGYSASEIMGQHHRKFVAPEYAGSSEYRSFWEKLARGEADSGQYQRVGKDGREIWLQASYNPIFDTHGRAFKVVKYATDITADKLKNADYQGQINAIDRIQGVIEFSLDGHVLSANDNFLQVLGYSREEAIGQHHSRFVEPDYAAGNDYRDFWKRLARGEADSGQYKRVGKGGREIWLQASYNPIFDMNGKPFKVVKYASDITVEKLRSADHEGQLSAIGKIQGVIEFSLDGKVIEVNDNFLQVLGYSRQEVIGQHHSKFVETSYSGSAEYQAFWQRLGRGQADSGQYKRVGKGGRELWLQASYNPIFDMNGKPFKVVKYATDITAQIQDSRALTSAVDETESTIAAAKAGDLSQRISLDGKSGVVERLCNGINSIMDRMTEVILQVKESAESITTAAGQISSGNNDLSQRTEQQASSLQETAASMDELASTVKQNAENAKQANHLASEASSVAIAGGTVVNDVVHTMASISESSKKIVDIISVIDGIAFQTNILALNAAVEAARAGEQGRGFAVVAGEVRTLAQRSAAAAKEIQQLISDSVQKVNNGTDQVEKAGTTMQEIVSSVKRVTDIMSEIAAASSEQSIGIDQVNTSVTQMDEVTQQNAALVEQAAAASESLVEQATALIDTVSEFRFNSAAIKSPAHGQERMLSVVGGA